MSFFSSLFAKKSSNNNKFQIKSVEINKGSVNTPSLHLKGKPDVYGLYPAELIMLSLSEKYKTTETNFPSFLIHTYGITNPLKMLKDLHNRMLIDVGSAKDCLLVFKLTELKEIAAALNISVKGKKAEIVDQLLAVPEDALGAIVKERTWKLTEKGTAALKANPYIQYFLDKHNYNVTEVGVNIWSVNEEFVKDPKRLYRDIIYGQLNKAMNEASIQFQKNPASGISVTSRYCECYRLMGLFIEEEGKSYINASDMYFQYLFKRINIHAGMQLLINWKTFNYDKKFRETFISQYYEEIQLYPFQKMELLRLLDELNVSGDEVRKSLIASFERAKDSGIMSVKEAADFVILELSGDVEKSRELAYKLAKKAVKNI
ncbi:MAG: SAP domain-containing protein [Firmicutes bacterium]|nr:SAP domain-containing protein [Bacillota bacterium]